MQVLSIKHISLGAHHSQPKSSDFGGLVVTKQLILQLLAGMALFAVTAMAAINTVATNSTPYNLLKLDVKFDQAE